MPVAFGVVAALTDPDAFAAVAGADFFAGLAGATVSDVAMVHSPPI
jgi:hypothetical protein